MDKRCGETPKDQQEGKRLGTVRTLFGRWDTHQPAPGVLLSACGFAVGARSMGAP